MKLIFYILLLLYACASVILSNFDYQFSTKQIYGALITIIIISLIAIPYRKFSNTGKVSYLILASLVVSCRAGFLYLILRKDLNNLIKNEQYLYLSSILLLIFFAFHYSKMRCSRPYE